MEKLSRFEMFKVLCKLYNKQSYLGSIKDESDINWFHIGNLLTAVMVFNGENRYDKFMFELGENNVLDSALSIIDALYDYETSNII